jgi:orotate phosphoribosyltransferase
MIISPGTVIPGPGQSLFTLARRCDALYICPTEDGKRKGPLVPYAGKDSQQRNLVGDIYFNFRRIEEQSLVLQAYAEVVVQKLNDANLVDSFDTICGIPQGGRTFGQALAHRLCKRFTYADKKPLPKVEGKKQEYEWDLSQFAFVPGERVAVVEDVCNNFQNTDITLAQIAATGAKPVIILCALNRSPVFDRIYTPKGSGGNDGLVVVAAIREAYPEYEQDNAAVAEDIAAGNIEWEVKKNWARLMSLMEPLP